MVYDINGNQCSPYSKDGILLAQAYDVEGNELLSGIVANSDTATGVDSGYVLSNGIRSYIVRLLASWGTSIELQSCIKNDVTGNYERMDSTNTVVLFDSSMSNVGNKILSDTGGHKNDGISVGGLMYTSGGDNTIFYWGADGNVLTKVVPVSNNPNGSTTRIGGISLSETNSMWYLVSRDKYGDSEIAHQAGDKMNVYLYDFESNTATLVAQFPWDCVYVQGATYCDGILYVACNTQTTGAANNYTGVTIKCIRTDTYELFDTFTMEGSYEPEGMDTIYIDGNPCLTFGLGKWNTLHKLLLITPPYKLVDNNGQS